MRGRQFFVGYFSSDKEMWDFFEENDRAGDDSPISKFCESQGEKWIDHDHMEVSQNGDQGLRSALKNWSQVDSWVRDVLVAVDNADLPDNAICTAVLYNDSCVDEPRSVEGPGFRVVFLGQF